MSDHQSRSYIPVAKPVIGELETDYVLKAIREGEVSSRGRFVTEFESRFAKRVGAEKARQLRDRGSDPNRRYWQADLGVAQLEQMDLFLQRRREIVLSYQRRFTGVSEIKLQLEETWAKPVAWMVSILVNAPIRDSLMKSLQEKDIETRPFFYPIQTMPAHWDENANCPISESVSSQGINLPSGVPLTNGDIDRVSSAVCDFLSKEHILR